MQVDSIDYAESAAASFATTGGTGTAARRLRSRRAGWRITVSESPGDAAACQIKDKKTSQGRVRPAQGHSLRDAPVVSRGASLFFSFRVLTRPGRPVSPIPLSQEHDDGGGYASSKQDINPRTRTPGATDAAPRGTRLGVPGIAIGCRAQG